MAGNHFLKRSLEKAIDASKHHAKHHAPGTNATVSFGITTPMRAMGCLSGQQFVGQGVGHGGGAAGHFEFGKDVLDAVRRLMYKVLLMSGLEAPSASKRNTSSSRELSAGRAGSARARWRR